LVVGCTSPEPGARIAGAEPRPRVAAPTPSFPRPAVPARATRGGPAVVRARVGDVAIAYVADSDDGVVRAVDAEHLSEISALDVGGAPEQLLLTRNGRLFATVRDANALVAIEGTGTEGDPMRVARVVSTAAEPVGLASTPDESTLLVASGWGHALAAYDATTLAKRFTRDLGREPRGVVVSDDGKRAFVSHAVGADIDVIPLDGAARAARVSMESVESLGDGRFFLGDFPTHAGQGFAVVRGIAPAGRVFVPHARIRTARVSGPEEEASSGYGSAEAGPTEAFDVAVLDEDTGKPIPGWRDTDGGLACVLPRAAAVTGAGELLVACVGTGEIVAMDAAAANPHQAVVRRWNVPAGPSGISVDETSPRALVWSQFGHALAWIALEGRGSAVLASSELARRAPLPEAVARGRALFHSAGPRLSADGRACASCHPDGRDDGLVWDTPDGPRNPPMLAGRLERAAPYGWTGASKDVSSHLAKTFRRLGGLGLKGDDKAALVAYVASMKPPTPALADADDARLQEGHRIFESPAAGCAGCHGARGAGPDGMAHNVRSQAKGDGRASFDTPSLRFVGGTAPYFHDGRYASLRSLLRHTRGTMGQNEKLGPRELDALEAYVRSL
jgi:mono/diheme cytochrome c family protein